ncbi:unnamed protein product [Malus baccata var. baccata]
MNPKSIPFHNRHHVVFVRAAIIELETKMANLTKLDFVALNITGKNYLTRVMDAKIHLEAGNLGETIKEDNSASSQDQANAMILIRRYLDEGLKSEYLKIENPLTLWNALKNRYNHQKTMILPRARYEWAHLRIQDFKTVTEYNSAMFRISSQLKLCGETIIEEDMLEKTFSTFHASNVLLQQQYREKGFTQKYHILSWKYYKRGNGHEQGRWNGKGKNHGVQFHNQVLRYNLGPSFKNANRQKGKAHMNTPINPEGVCHRCGGNGHWARICRTPKHLVDLYQASLKEKGVEINFLDQAQPMEISDPVSNLSGQLNIIHHLDISNFIIERMNEVYGSD